MHTADFFNDVNDALAGTTPVRGLVRLPKFEFKTEFKMNDALIAMGMPSAFSSAADFSKISDMPVRVSYVKQDAVIKVDEKGTEAAAVTSIGIEATSLPPPPQFEFVADRPFYYFIKDNSTGVILFAGQVVQP